MVTQFLVATIWIGTVVMQSCRECPLLSNSFPVIEYRPGFSLERGSQKADILGTSTLTYTVCQSLRINRVGTILIG